MLDESIPIGISVFAEINPKCLFCRKSDQFEKIAAGCSKSIPGEPATGDTMSNTCSLGNKVLVSATKPDENSKTIVASVTNCLASHEQCTGSYTDFSSRYVIICQCKCHKRNESKNANQY